MHERCRNWHWLIEFSGVVFSCLRPSRSTVFHGSITKLATAMLTMPLLKVILDSVSGVRKIVNNVCSVALVPTRSHA